jgi:hypothetical protein
VFITDLPYKGRFYFIDVLTQKDDYISSDDDGDDDTASFDGDKFNILTRQVVATISIQDRCDKVPKFYLIGVDIIEKVKTADERVSWFITLTFRLEEIFRYSRYYVKQAENLFRPTCLVPLGGVLRITDTEGSINA